MTSFVVHGPFPITFHKKPGGRTLDFSDFWEQSDKTAELARRKGCYVFAVKNGRGSTPIYVGKATRTFKQETFNPANRFKYSNGFSDYQRGKPVMYFVVHPIQRGQANTSHIGSIEDFLIQAGVIRNPDLQNIKGRQAPGWSIKGVIRTGVGARTTAEREFLGLFGLG